MLRRAGADVGLGDRVVAAEDDRDRARREHLPDRRLDRLVRARRIGGQDRRVAEVDHLQLGEGVDLRLEVLARAGSSPRGSPAARSACPAGPRRDRRSARRRPRRQRPSSSAGILGVGQAAEGEQACVVGLLAVFAPAVERIDHGAILPPTWAILPSRGSTRLSRALAAARLRADGLEERFAVELVEPRVAARRPRSPSAGRRAAARSRRRGRCGRERRERLAADRDVELAVGDEVRAVAVPRPRA